MGGIKLQFFTGVRIELAVDSLPYMAWFLTRSLPIPFGGTYSTSKEDTAETLGTFLFL